MNRTVTLVDERNQPQGEMDLLEAHTGKGSLHRAFSVYVFRNGRSELLIQRRSAKKMLWPGIWANTCCSHPFTTESAVQAGERRLQEELGFTTALTQGPSFVYRAEDPHGKGVEHEHVTILFGDIDADPEITPNEDEVGEVRWITLEQLQDEFEEHANQYAPWLREGIAIIFDIP